VTLHPKELRRLIKAMKGTFFGMFGGNPLALMRKLKLSPNSMPFGDGSTTILQYAQQHNLKSVKYLQEAGACGHHGVMLPGHIHVTTLCVRT